MHFLVNENAVNKFYQLSQVKKNNSERKRAE